MHPHCRTSATASTAPSAIGFDCIHGDRRAPMTDRSTTDRLLPAGESRWNARRMGNVNASVDTRGSDSHRRIASTMFANGFRSVIAAILAGALCACTGHAPFIDGTSSTQGTTVVQRGKVLAVRDVLMDGGNQPVAGGLIGGIVGGILGSTLGGGNGHLLGAAGGSVAGTIAGHEAGSAVSAQRVTRLTIGFADGSEGIYDVPTSEHFAVGDAVTVTSNNRESRVTH